MQQVFIAAAPNGARLTRADHPGVPLSAHEIAREAAQCVDAGACMLHLHVRDREGRHTLDPDAYRDSIDAINSAIADRLVVQMSTESVGRYQPSEQMHAVLQVRPEEASIALRELAPRESDESSAIAFFAECAREEIALQHIVYDAGELARLRALHMRGDLCTDEPSVLLVLGRERSPPRAEPRDLAAALAADTAWLRLMICAFGAPEHELCFQAAANGLHVRIGFENNIRAPDGALAESTAANIANLRERLQRKGHSIGGAEAWRR